MGGEDEGDLNGGWEGEVLDRGRAQRIGTTVQRLNGHEEKG